MLRSLHTLHPARGGQRGARSAAKLKPHMDALDAPTCSITPVQRGTGGPPPSHSGGLAAGAPPERARTPVSRNLAACGGSRWKSASVAAAMSASWPGSQWCGAASSLSGSSHLRRWSTSFSPAPRSPPGVPQAPRRAGRALRRPAAARGRRPRGRAREPCLAAEHTRGAAAMRAGGALPYWTPTGLGGTPGHWVHAQARVPAWRQGYARQRRAPRPVHTRQAAAGAHPA